MVDSEWKETDRGDRFREDSHRMHRLKVESNSGDSPQVGVTEQSVTDEETEAERKATEETVTKMRATEKTWR